MSSPAGRLRVRRACDLGVHAGNLGLVRGARSLMPTEFGLVCRGGARLGVRVSGVAYVGGSYEMAAPAVRGSPPAPATSGRGQCRDVAEGSNGAVLLAARTGTDGYVLRLRSDGGSETVARYAGPGRALGVGADVGGAVLVLEGWGNRLSRVSSSGTSQVLAGTGRPGFSGDGGPAISADIDVGFVPLAGVVRTVTGATALTDSLNQRVRRIQPDGRIETIAVLALSTAV